MRWRRTKSFNYALFDRAETELIGCVYIDPPSSPDMDAEIDWWVRDEYVGTRRAGSQRACTAVDRRRVALPAPTFRATCRANPELSGDYRPDCDQLMPSLEP